MSRAPLVCFDLGRVLVRICDDWGHAFREAGLQGIAPPSLDPATRRRLGEAVHALELGQLELEEFAARGASALGLEAAHLRTVVDVFILGPYPGAVALLELLARAGLRTACLSNTNARHWQLMSSWSEDEQRILDRLTYRFASHQIGARKPDPAAYARVESDTGFAPEEILFFDDLAENVAAASARGWRATLIDPRGDPIAQLQSHLQGHVLPSNP